MKFLSVAASMMAMSFLAVGCTSTLNRDEEVALNQAAGIEVTQADMGVKVKLPEAALFDFGKWSLRDNAIGVIDRSAVLLKRSDKSVQVNGYTDNVGLRDYNEKLSLDRANVVAKALIQRGIASERVSVVGHAWDSPVASNDTPEGRVYNRRTEVVVIGESMDALMGKSR
ncbi:flagellar motor protein MotB [Burkholderia sp. HI2714]|uniref:OmpA family protein n=1 Tax=Burkholderia sp. HI2714 TaxID=2015359 RepID=UPI000B7AA974|nr:OmpA family protein [Burkholderia sp. HI2714]OXJ21492.1 flagellar motor protein MotB [Burkholderia sp. HI2714]